MAYLKRLGVVADVAVLGTAECFVGFSSVSLYLVTPNVIRLASIYQASLRALRQLRNFTGTGSTAVGLNSVPTVFEPFETEHTMAGRASSCCGERGTPRSVRVDKRCCARSVTESSAVKVAEPFTDFSN